MTLPPNVALPVTAKVPKPVIAPPEVKGPLTTKLKPAPATVDEVVTCVLVRVSFAPKVIGP